MAEQKKANTVAADDTTTENGKGTPAGSPAVSDPTGTISNREDASGTRQTEPKPEDYPASAKVPSPAAQINTAAEQAVGEAGTLTTGDEQVDKALNEADASRKEAIASTDERFAKQAKDDGLLK